MPVVMVLVGYLVGANGLGLIGMDVQSSTVRTIAEITLALMLFHDAVRIDLRALRRGYSVPLRLLAIGLPLMIVIGTLVAWGMFPAAGFVGALLIATMLAPTDAALGAAVVSDERLPMRIRQGLNVESGLNDGLSVPVFLVALALAADPTAWHLGSLGAELLRQIGFGILGGLLVGGLGGLAFRLAARRGLMHDYWRRLAILSVALGCFVSAAALGGSGFIGAFAGGLLFGLASEARSPSDNALTGYLGSFFDAVSFLLVGAMLLPLALASLTWQIVTYAVLSLVVIRVVVGRHRNARKQGALADSRVHGMVRPPRSGDGGVHDSAHRRRRAQRHHDRLGSDRRGDAQRLRARVHGPAARGAVRALVVVGLGRAGNADGGAPGRRASRAPGNRWVDPAVSIAVTRVRLPALPLLFEPTILD